MSASQPGPEVSITSAEEAESSEAKGPHRKTALHRVHSPLSAHDHFLLSPPITSPRTSTVTERQLCSLVDNNNRTTVPQTSPRARKRSHLLRTNAHRRATRVSGYLSQVRGNCFGLVNLEKPHFSLGTQRPREKPYAMGQGRG